VIRYNVERTPQRTNVNVHTRAYINGKRRRCRRIKSISSASSVAWRTTPNAIRRRHAGHVFTFPVRKFDRGSSGEGCVVRVLNILSARHPSRTRNTIPTRNPFSLETRERSSVSSLRFPVPESVWFRRAEISDVKHGPNTFGAIVAEVSSLRKRLSGRVPKRRTLLIIASGTSSSAHIWQVRSYDRRIHANGHEMATTIGD